MDDPITLDLTYLDATPTALLLLGKSHAYYHPEEDGSATLIPPHQDEHQTWLPKELVVAPPEMRAGEIYGFTMPRWLAEGSSLVETSPG